MLADSRVRSRRSNSAHKCDASPVRAECPVGPDGRGSKTGDADPDKSGGIPCLEERLRPPNEDPARRETRATLKADLNLTGRLRSYREDQASDQTGASGKLAQASLISTFTPAARSSFISASTVWAFG